MLFSEWPGQLNEIDKWDNGTEAEILQQYLKRAALGMSPVLGKF
jgi:hypothetical protein